MEERRAYAEKWELDPKKQWIALLPGSRRGELEHNAAIYNVPDVLGQKFEYLIPIAPTLTPEHVQQSRKMGCDILRQDGKSETEIAEFNSVHYVANAFEALYHSRAAVVASGTATVEAALAGTPFVVVYRLSGLTWRLGRRLVKLEHFAMPNLIAGRRVVPELIQDDFTAENVVAELEKIIPDGPEREQMIAGLAEVREKLRPSNVPAAERAAQALIEVLSAQV